MNRSTIIQQLPIINSNKRNQKKIDQIIQIIIIMMKVEMRKFQDEITEYKVDTHSTRNQSEKNLELNLVSEVNEANVSVHRISNTRGILHNQVLIRNQNTLVFAVSHDCSDIRLKDIFKKIATKINFTIKQDATRRIIVTKPIPPNYLKELLCCCLGINATTLVTFEIRNDSIHRKKTVTIKYLVGDLNQYNKIVELLKEQIKTLTKDDKQELLLLIHKRGNNKYSPFNLEITAFDFIANLFRTKYASKCIEYKERIAGIRKGIEAPSSKKKIESLIEELVKIAKEIVSELGYHNYHTELVMYCTEKYLTLLVEKDIYQTYSSRYEKKNLEYQQKRAIILQKWNDEKCMEFLEIKPKYRLICGNATAPYLKAIETLENLDLEISLRQKLKCVQLYYSNIKICCYEFHKGKEEIATMDDILPVMIFTVLKAKVRNFYANIKMIDDYIKVCGRFQTDQRVITNIFVGLQYVAKQWVVSMAE